MAQRHLRRVARCAAHLAKAEAAFKDAVIAAHESGESMRAISAASKEAPGSGISHQRVSQIIQEHRRKQRKLGE